MNTVQAVFLAGGPVQSGDVFAYITNPDGSTSNYHYMGASFMLTEPGNYQGDDLVKQTVTFKATQRVSI